ncbi:hypothetical protein [Clostridium butyricum]|uniref:hypothetical protein n=1 Tax=Clostridium butyricum TaxID=1492 RepID=UPI0018AACFB7|nr:hypothetical protein [Clostridium butyricum]
MSKDKPELKLIDFLSEGLKLEWGSSAGRYNVLFTVLVCVMVILYSLGDIPLTIIYYLCFKEKYEVLSLNQTVKYPIICGGLCFLYMVIMSYCRYKVTSKVNEHKEENEDNSIEVTDDDNEKAINK